MPWKAGWSIKATGGSKRNLKPAPGARPWWSPEAGNVLVREIPAIRRLEVA